ncbi:MAG: hypothetical protein U1E36_02170 [Rickettsiales bacterium]
MSWTAAGNRINTQIQKIKQFDLAHLPIASWVRLWDDVSGIYQKYGERNAAKHLVSKQYGDLGRLVSIIRYKASNANIKSSGESLDDLLLPEKSEVEAANDNELPRSRYKMPPELFAIVPDLMKDADKMYAAMVEADMQITLPKMWEILEHYIGASDAPASLRELARNLETTLKKEVFSAMEIEAEAAGKPSRWTRLASATGSDGQKQIT